MWLDGEEFAPEPAAAEGQAGGEGGAAEVLVPFGRDARVGVLVVGGREPSSPCLVLQGWRCGAG